MSLANLGYLGHMWELYAMWTWMAAFVAASEQVRRGGDPVSSGVPALVTFAVIGSGAVGCWLGGRYADRWGRTLVTSVAMAISGSCALSVGALFARSLVRARSPAAGVGRRGRRGFRAVLRRGERARPPGLGGHRAHTPDEPRVPAHLFHDLSLAVVRRSRRVAVEHEPAGARPCGRGVRDAGAAAAAGGATARWRPGLGDREDPYFAVEVVDDTSRPGGDDPARTVDSHVQSGLLERRLVHSPHRPGSSLPAVGDHAQRAGDGGRHHAAIRRALPAHRSVRAGLGPLVPGPRRDPHTLTQPRGAPT